MHSGTNKKNLPAAKRIIFWILLPVVVIVTAISGVSIFLLSAPMESLVTENFEANLRLASKLGLRICETHFNQLLDMRLEDDPEMNKALRREALAEINAIAGQLHKVHMLVVEDRQYLKTIPSEFSGAGFALPADDNPKNKIFDLI